MTTEEALIHVESILDARAFSNIQELVFCRAWEGLSYAEIADRSGYDAEYIKQVGCQTWQLLSQALGYKISKSNCQSVLKRHANRNSLTITQANPEFKISSELIGEKIKVEHRISSRLLFIVLLF